MSGAFDSDGPVPPRRRARRRRARPKPLGRAAYVGVVGELLDLVAPQSEADPAAILAHVLAYTGSAVGPGPHFRVEGCRHGCNTNFMIVGSTSQGRKGTSEAYPRRLLGIADDEWAARCIASGLSSGEGLINHVRDPREVGTNKKTGEPITIAGAADKRAAVLESEFGRTLKAMGREGNTLSQVIRQAWDSGNLSVITKDPVVATGAHVSIVGHVVQHELLTRLDDAAVFGGTMNRFVFFVVERQRQLPFGGRVDEGALEQIGRVLGRHLAAARESAGEYRFTAAARAAWPEHYDVLTGLEQQPGIAGALLGRSIPQVRRLAMLYAVCDGATEVDEHHVLAAREVWRYAAESITNIFGDRMGNPLADQIEDGLREAPDQRLSRSEIRTLVGGRARGEEIDQALDLLENYGRASCEFDRSTGGRPKEFWILRA